MRKIVTTEKISIEGVKVDGIGTLSPSMRKWVIETRKNLLKRATLPEKIAANMLSRLEERPVRQAFFMIRGRCYFLDFFIRGRMLAIEIDGSSHNTRKKEDRRRDNDMRSIGIRTIRIKNKDVMEGNLFKIMLTKLYK